MPALGLKGQSQEVVIWSLNESGTMEGEPPKRSASHSRIQILSKP